MMRDRTSHVRPRLRWLSLLLLPRTLSRLLLTLVLVWGGIGLYRTLGVAVHGAGLARSARTLWQGLRSEQGMSESQARRVRAQLGYFEQDLTGLARWAQPLTCPVARWVPRTGIGRLGVLMCDGLQVSAGLVNTVWWSLLEVESAAGSLERTQEPFQAAITRLSLDRSHLQGLRPAAVRVASATQGMFGLPQAAERMAALGPGAIDALLLAPELLGGDARRVFLVLLQNPDELRATGGFISSVAVITLQGYRLQTLDYINSYDVETEGYEMPPAPPPLESYMKAGGLAFRDANWSPDFPTSAQVLGALYRASREPVDGIVAVDTHLLKAILDVIGPVYVPRYEVTITGDNLLDVSETFWANPLQGASLAQREVNLWDWLQHRKDFGADFIQAGRAHLAGREMRTWLSLAETLVTGLSERHLQAWALESGSVQKDLARSGWSGAVLPVSGDYLMVVDSNVGFNKVDRRIERAIAYHVNLMGDVPQATVTLTITNTSTARLDACVHHAQVLESYDALTQQCYWNYVRVLVPRGAELIETQGTSYAVDHGLDGGRTSFGTLVVVPPGETVTLSFRYALPLDITCDGNGCRYVLTVQKQPGTQAVPLQFSTDVVPGALRISGSQVTSPAKTSTLAALPLSTTLQIDRTIVLDWSP